MRRIGRPLSGGIALRIRKPSVRSARPPRPPLRPWKQANSLDADLRRVRHREPGDREVLPRVRVTPRDRAATPGVPQGRDHRVFRPEGLDCDGREARLRVAARGDDALLRLDARRARAPRRRHREVHRGRDHGRLRAAQAPRGRRAARSARRRGHEARAGCAERRARAAVGRPAHGPHRGEHRRSRCRRPIDRPAARHRRYRQRRRSPRAGSGRARDIARRPDVSPRARLRRRGARRAARAQGQVGARSGVSARRPSTRTPSDLAGSTRR